MARLTIRDLDDDLKAQLCIRDAQHGLSMEEVRRILQQILSSQNPQKGFGTRVHQRVMALTGGINLPLPIRYSPRAAPDFAGDQA